MISRAQGKTLPAEVAVSNQPKLSTLEKAMLKWAVVDPDDRLLDTNIGTGVMAEYLRRNMQCEVCGVSDDMDHVRLARTRLRSCDIAYAPPGDIPWKEGAFDTVLMKYRSEDPLTLSRVIEEIVRVLKPGGQLIVGTVYYPALINAIAALVVPETEEEHHPFCRSEVEEMLHTSGFEKITWQRTSFATGVMIAWKRKPAVEEMLNAVL